MGDLDPKEIVRSGYDLVSHAYRGDDFGCEGSAYEAFLGWVLPELRAESRVLDLGCGNGLPVSRVLAERCRVIGVDISPVQIERARDLVPGAEFVCADMVNYTPSPPLLDGVVAFYSLIHIPVTDQPALLERIHSWLRPSGFLLAVVGAEEWTGTEDDWAGVAGATMYWSHPDPLTSRAWFEEGGFTIEREGFIPEGDGGGHTILLARA
ncbi:MAG TPA: class I SAM-dependent methyltransferase [Tepidiformaceae bacterium]|nr:class I SAM-dependent methyltransferase [Tepidiformaceae bacterium]